MVIQEAFEAQKLQVPVKIFAIERVRSGRYPHTIAADVTPQRLERFFVRTQDEHVVVDAIRAMVVFAPQNITKDPPFSHLDLISCRNLLIYMEPELQRRTVVEGFEMEWQSPEAGARRLVLNARRIHGDDARPDLILLAPEDEQ